MSRSLIHPHQAAINESPLHPLVHLRGLFPGIQRRPLGGIHAIHLPIHVTNAGLKHGVAGMVDQFAPCKYPITEAMAALEQVMGSASMPQAAVNEQQLQTR